MVKLRLRDLVEMHFKPKWWQFWRKQEYHVCYISWNWSIARTTNCIWNKEHPKENLADVKSDRIIPRCFDGCKEILASDPGFFTKLDEFLNRDCVDLPDNRPKDVAVASCPAGPSGSPGPAGKP